MNDYNELPNEENQEPVYVPKKPRHFLKRSSVKDKRPGAYQMEYGEIALNFNSESMGLFAKGTDGLVHSLGVSDSYYGTSEKAGLLKPDENFEVNDEGGLSLYEAMKINEIEYHPVFAENGYPLDYVRLNWECNKVPVLTKINAQTVDNELYGEKEFVYEEPLTHDIQFGIEVVDDRHSIDYKEVTVKFCDKVYYQFADDIPTEVTEDLIKSLPFNQLCPSIEYFDHIILPRDSYFVMAVPTTYGQPIFSLEDGSKGKFTKIGTSNITNEYDYTTEYTVWVSSSYAKYKALTEIKFLNKN